jgi:hypothetical protein
MSNTKPAEYRIFKFLLKVTDVQEIPLNPGDRILTAQMQGSNGLCLWALVDLNVPAASKRTIHIFGTGNPLPDMSKMTYISSAQELGGKLVWHIFEEVK